MKLVTPFHIPAAAALILISVGTANITEAKCGPSTLATGGYNAYKAHPYRAKTHRNADQPAATAVSITGLWHTEFLDGDMVVDEGFDLWHSDGTEVLNDVTPTLAGNVCLGVWTQTGPLSYTLKHPSWIYDDPGVNVIGVVYLNEQITLDAGGDSYTGILSIDAFDMDGNSLGHQDGKIAATRIKAI